MKRSRWSQVKRSVLLGALVVATSGAASTGCGGRDEVWDTAVSRPLVVRRLSTAAVVVDAPAERVVALSVGPDEDGAALGLGVGSLPIGRAEARLQLLLGRQHSAAPAGAAAGADAVPPDRPVRGLEAVCTAAGHRRTRCCRGQRQTPSPSSPDHGPEHTPP